jgi:hypothetical protein
MSLARILRETAYVASLTGTDSYGKPLYGTPRPVLVRVEAKRTKVTNARGEEAVANHRIWCLEALLLSDRIWLPGAARIPETANLPFTVSSCGDFTGSRTLYRAEF